MADADCETERHKMQVPTPPEVWTRELGEKVLEQNLLSRNIPVHQSLKDAIAAHTGDPQMTKHQQHT